MPMDLQTSADQSPNQDPREMPMDVQTSADQSSPNQDPAEDKPLTEPLKDLSQQEDVPLPPDVPEDPPLPIATRGSTDDKRATGPRRRQAIDGTVEGSLSAGRCAPAARTPRRSSAAQRTRGSTDAKCATGPNRR